MSISADDFEITLKNEKIWYFYNENKNISIEQANLLMIDFLQSIFNKVTNDTSTNVNAQLLSFIQDNHTQMNAIKTNLQSMNENMSKMNNEITQNMLLHFVTLKKEYIEDVKQIVSNNALTTSEKMSALLDKNSDHLIDKTTLILNDALPKNQEQWSRQLQEDFRTFHATISQETTALLGSANQEKSLQEFITSFDTKYQTMMQSVQAPILSIMNASEERIHNDIEKLKETSSTAMVGQSKIFDDLGEFLGKYKGSSNKGKYGEQNLSTILNSMYPTAEIRDTTGQKASGDFIMKRLDKPVILFETKEYDQNMTKDEVAKFIRDIDTQNVNGIFMSQYSGIAFKQNFQIDIHKGNVLVYIQHCEHSMDKIKVAVDIIDHLSSRIEELNIDDTNTISKEILDDINTEYQAFINQKEGLIMVLKDFSKKMTNQIDDLKLPVLDKYLAPKYASVKSNVHTCDLCGVFTASTKQSISAHKRGCSKKQKSKDELSNSIV